ncbi:MAG TPA: TonB-dependent receptor plug domain-containing protein [Steroidobacteraceae bacterium]|nr:TonB-dependent receptor plug domain-containing protein [Steroidobacteraceae bacterium]
MLDQAKSYCSSATKFPALCKNLAGLLILVLCCHVRYICAADAATVVDFKIKSSTLGDALDLFSAQTGLQVLYEQEAVQTRRHVSVRNQLSIGKALDQLLRGSGLTWRFVNIDTVAIIRPSHIVAESEEEKASPPVVTHSKRDIITLSDVEVRGQRWLGNDSSTVIFGINKSLLETPRSVSSISDDTIDLFSLSAVEDLLHVAPGVFTTTRFGIQGSVDIRNVPADTYFRGMKRLTLQGHGRSVLAAMDSIEIVGGPASPLYGMGKIGGYTNVVPKSGRAKSGKYLTDRTGFTQIIAGQYDRKEFSFGMGGPLETLNAMGKQSGYYLYGLLEDSNSFARGVPVKQLVLQAAISVDNFAGPFRLETGASYQVSRTAGALVGRLTQELVDSDDYIGGSPLADLDLDHNGYISYLEFQTASPVRGALSNNNQPLVQTWGWPRDAQGQPLALDQFPQITGIPQSMYDYLQSHPQSDPTGLLRAQGVGGPIPLSGSVPVGMMLDPSTVMMREFNPRNSSAFERSLRAEFITAYADLIYDQNPAFTLKNQLFFDSMSQYKSSNQPFSQIQNVYVVEDKVTATHEFVVPGNIRINALAAINLRDTISSGSMTLADYGNHRTDATAPDWNEETGGLTYNTTFASSNENSTINGLPWASIYRTDFSEMGAGVLLDIELPSHTNVMLGGRFDVTHARNTDYAGRYNFSTGTTSNPGAVFVSDDVATSWDHSPSWSISISQKLPYDIHPYVTLARSSITLDSNNNSFTNPVIRAGPIGNSSLKEAGLKSSLFNGKGLLSIAAYKQGRTDVTDSDDASLLNAYATATTTWGWQSELKWTIGERALLSAYLIKQTTDYTPNVGGSIQVDARALGFKDVVDQAGKIIYPAEAFLYGGRARILLPNGMEQYKKKQGNPGTQVGISGVFNLVKSLGITVNANYLSSTCSGRLCLVRLPQSHVYDFGAFWNSKQWDAKLDIFNITNERYFRARTGDTLGDVIAQSMPGRRYQLTVKFTY